MNARRHAPRQAALPTSTGRPRRVLIGTHEVARQVHGLASGFRTLGHEVTTVVDAPHRFYDDPYDIVLRSTVAAHRAGSLRADALLRHLTQLVASPAAAVRLYRLIRAHDTFVFVWGKSLLPQNLDLPLLRALGKTVLSCFLGTDIRHWSATEPARRAASLGSYAAYRDARSLDLAVHTLRFGELYSDATFFQPSYGELAIAPYMHLYLAVDTASYREQFCDREVPVVLHAPSNRALKGTDEIVAAVTRLKDEGVAFDFRLLEGEPNTVVARALADADIVIDQLNESHHGLFALEALSAGCVVLGGNREDVVPIPADRPVIHVSSDTLYGELRRVIEDRVFRGRQARAGRAFVERHHQPSVVAARMLAAPAQLLHHGADYQPSFFIENYRLPDDCRMSRTNRWLTKRVAKQVGISATGINDLVARGLA